MPETREERSGARLLAKVRPKLASGVKLDAARLFGRGGINLHLARLPERGGDGFVPRRMIRT